MQVIRALLAAKEITTIINQRQRKTNATKCLWGRGRRMTTSMRAVLTNTKKAAHAQLAVTVLPRQQREWPVKASGE